MLLTVHLYDMPLFKNLSKNQIYIYVKLFFMINIHVTLGFQKKNLTSVPQTHATCIGNQLEIQKEKVFSCTHTHTHKSFGWIIKEFTECTLYSYGVIPVLSSVLLSKAAT